MTESGFSKAQSNNLPRLDQFMVARFFANNELFSSAEIRGVKFDRASRDSYGDSPIGYIQVKREESICIVKGEICPEHRLNVTLEIDGNAEEFQSVLCHDCAAALELIRLYNKRLEQALDHPQLALDQHGSVWSTRNTLMSPPTLDVLEETDLDDTEKENEQNAPKRIKLNDTEKKKNLKKKRLNGMNANEAKEKRKRMLMILEDIH